MRCTHVREKNWIQQENKFSEFLSSGVGVGLYIKVYDCMSFVRQNFLYGRLSICFSSCIFHSCIFHHCYLLMLFPLLQFPPLLSSPVVSTPAFSAPPVIIATTCMRVRLHHILNRSSVTDENKQTLTNKHSSLYICVYAYYYAIWQQILSEYLKYVHAYKHIKIKAKKNIIYKL